MLSPFGIGMVPPWLSWMSAQGPQRKNLFSLIMKTTPHITPLSPEKCETEIGKQSLLKNKSTQQEVRAVDGSVCRKTQENVPFAWFTRGAHKYSPDTCQQNIRQPAVVPSGRVIRNLKPGKVRTTRGPGGWPCPPQTGRT